MMNASHAPALPRVLCLLQLPPPLHGSSVVGSWIHNSRIVNGAVTCEFLNISGSISLDDDGRAGVRKALRYAVLFLRLAGRLTARRYDLCYFAITARGIAFYRDVVLIMLLKLRGIRLVYHLHNKGVSTRQDRALDHQLYRWVFHRSEVILLSQRLYPDIAKYVRSDRVHLCPNGIPGGDRVDRLPRGRKPVELLFLGNLIESKGVFVLLEACRLLKEEGLDFHCTLVGGIGDIAASEVEMRVQREGLEKHVSYRGPQFGAEKAARFRDADVFVLPTFYHFECLPLVILEAMRYALPVVSTDEGGIPDLVLDGITGFVCPRRDAVAIAQKLRMLICDESLRRRLGEAGWLRFEKEYTLEHFEHRLAGILQKVALSGSAAGNRSTAVS